MTEQKLALARLLRCTGRRIRRAAQNQVRATGVYQSQNQLLVLVHDHPEDSQTQLAARMEISPAAVAMSLSKLEQEGYLYRCPAPDSCREKRICLTEKGARVAAESCVILQELDQRLFDGFSPAELDALCAGLEHIRANLRQLEE